MDYDKQVARIKKQNKPLLEDFQRWLEKSGLSSKTVRNHVQNVEFFTEYQIYYEPLEPLVEAVAGDFLTFSIDWFPRKAMWASAASARSNMTSFRKFAKFMLEAGHWSRSHVEEIKSMFKEHRDEIIDSAGELDDYYW